MKLTGKCLCEEIEFEISSPFGEFGHCYCKRCRKATGAGRSTVLVTGSNQLKWTKGEEKLRRWDMTAASSFATSFCFTCGCPLPRLTRNSEYVVVPAGSIDSDIPVSPRFHEHFSSKANWVCLNETELEVFDGESQ